MLTVFPTRLHHYAIQSLLGEGHIGFVYRATHTLTGQEVALKVLREDSPVDEARRYFENEAALCAGLHHNHIPTLHEYLPDHPPCLAFQRIHGKDGETLLSELSEGAFLPVEQVVQWGIHIADALAYLHQQRIIFRDLKASHIMVDTNNQVWLVDFNLALTLPPGQSSVTAEAIGTEGFNPPEQYHGLASPLVDSYALGATLHYLLTRIDPRKERAFTYAPPRSINPAIPKSLAHVIMQALAYEPEDRFATMPALRTALESV